MSFEYTCSGPCKRKIRLEKEWKADYSIRCADCDLLILERTIKKLGPLDPNSPEELAKLGLGYAGPALQ